MRKGKCKEWVAGISSTDAPTGISSTPLLEQVLHSYWNKFYTYFMYWNKFYTTTGTRSKVCILE